jgi:hypothetical protein
MYENKFNNTPEVKEEVAANAVEVTPEVKEDKPKKKPAKKKPQAEAIVSSVEGKKDSIEEQMKALEAEMKAKLAALKEKQKEADAEKAEKLEKVFEAVSRKTKPLAKKWFKAKEDAATMESYEDVKALEKEVIDEIVSVFKAELGAIKPKKKEA